MMAAVLVDMLRLISNAFGDVEKMPAALIVCGGVLAAAALRLAVLHHSPPEGVFVRHGEVPFYLYRGTLIAVVIFGFMEVFAGLRLTGDPTSRQATGKTILGLSILPLIIVAALGGFA